MGYNKREHLKANILAIETAFKLDKENRKATDYEKEILSKYTGFGGIRSLMYPLDNPVWSESDKSLLPLAKELYDIVERFSNSQREFENYIESLKQSILTSFYTPPEFVQMLADVFEEKNIVIDHFLDPSAGMGIFVEKFQKLGTEKNNFVNLEADALTAKVAKHYLNDYQVYHETFQQWDAEDTKYDVITSNIPFENISASDIQFSNHSNKDIYKSASRKINTLFFVKALDNLKNGGILAFIGSNGLINSHGNENIRKWLMDNSNLISALRLPNNLFTDYSGTEAGTDLIILQKNIGKQQLTEREKLFTYSKFSEETGKYENQYFKDAKNIVHTDASYIRKFYGKFTDYYLHSGGVEGIVSDVKDHLKKDFELFDHHLYTTSQSVRNNIIEDKNLDNSQKTLFDEFFDRNRIIKKVNESSKSASIIKTQVKSSPKVTIQDFFNQLNLFENNENESKNENESRFIYQDITLPYYVSEKSLIIHNEQVGYIKKAYKRRKESIFSPLQLNKTDTNKFIKYLEIRKTANNLDNYEKEHKIENPELRDELNKIYDEFIAEYGFLRSKDNEKLFAMDSLSSEVLNLEKVLDGQFVKSDIFYQPVAFATNIVMEADTPSEALACSLNQYGKANLDYMLSLLKDKNITKEALLDELKERIYFNPINNEFEISELFLSGNVIEKLDIIQKMVHSGMENEQWAQLSIKALKNVIPKPIPYEELDFNFGERWINTSLYEDYVSEIFKTKVNIQYNSIVDHFSVILEKDNPITLEEFAVKRDSKKLITGKGILEHALLDTCPNFTKEILKDNKPVRVTDHESIQTAKSKIEQLRNGFTTWLNNQSLEVHESLADTYNRLFNCFAKPIYDGSHLTFPDLNLKNLGITELYPSQKNAIWMLILNDGGIVDHEVGLGKTLTMCISSYEQKRMGLKHKPMIIGLKTNIDEITKTFKKAYPNAKILAPTPADFTKNNRVNLFNNMRYNNYDCIIMSHEQFGKIPHSLQIQHDTIQRELDDIAENLRVATSNTGASNAQLKGLRIRQMNLDSKLSFINQEMKERQDDIADFSNMGIDMISIDESHQFKNLMFTTRHDRVSGIGNPLGSQRAMHLLMAIRTIQQRTQKDLGAAFFSGTTITNSMVELYLLFKYLRPQALDKQKITSFDSWAAVFAQKSTEYEIDITNDPILKERYRYFIKVPELSNFYAQITDYRSADEIKMDRPKANEILYKIKQTPDQEAFTQTLINFLKDNSLESGLLLGRPKLTHNELRAKKLIATNYSAKMSLDMRLIEPHYEDHEDNKASHCAKKIAEYYYKFNEHLGTQFVFSDLGVYKENDKTTWNIYSEIKRKLVEDYKIPENEIQFMQAAKTKTQKEEIKKKINSGEIRVIMGSTTTLGTGINAQERAVASHNLDIPWRPDMLTQRNGRTVRTNNKVAKHFANNQVDIYTYATEKTLDAYKFNLLKNKDHFIKQLKSGTLTIRRIDEGQFEENGISFAEYAAILSGNTDLIERAKLEKKISSLENEKRNFEKEKYMNKLTLQDSLKEVRNKEKIINNIKQDLKYWNSNIKEDTQLYLKGLKFNNLPKNDIKSIAGYLHDLNKNYMSNEFTQIGTLYDFKLLISTHFDMFHKMNFFYVEGLNGIKYQYNNGKIAENPKLASEYFFNALKKMPNILEKYENEVKALKQDIVIMEDITKKEWNKEKELVESKLKLVSIENKLKDTIHKTTQGETNKDESTHVKEQKTGGIIAPIRMEKKFKLR